MSSLTGRPGERWSLATAVDALGEAARQAGRPGAAWLAGIFYPAIGVGAASGWRPASIQVGPAAEGARLGLSEFAREIVFDAWLPLLALPFFAVMFLPLFRLVAGLARLGDPAAWNEASLPRGTPPLAALWRAGKGLMLSAYGLWLQLVLMQLVALLTLLLPAGLIVMSLLEAQAELDGAAVATLVVLAPLVFLLGLYLLTLSVLGQLGLQSLAANRRGVSSALLHAWRIARNDPWATLRAVLAEVVLILVVLGLTRAFGGLVRGIPGEQAVQIAFTLGLAGFSGVVRAAYWARAYRALGGLTPDDRVPGLVPA
jgi:hypothetical protein